MARLFLIIDGYNLMHAMGLGRSSYGPGDLERSRNQLIQQVNSALDHSVAADSVIVFDSSQTGHRGPPQNGQTPLHVMYSRDGRDADAEIELMLGCHSSPKQVLIISSDHRLHKAARRRKARCMDSEDFCSQLEPSRNRSKNRRLPGGAPKQSTTAGNSADLNSQPHNRPPERPSSSSESEIDYAVEFLNIDIDEIKRSVRKEQRSL